MDRELADARSLRSAQSRLPLANATVAVAPVPVEMMFTLRGSIPESEG